MPKVIIMNAGTEQMLGGEFTSGQRLLATKAGWRQLWFAEQGDLIVMPASAGREWLEYVGSLKGFDPASVTVITLDGRDGQHEVLSDEQLLSPALIERVKAHLGRGDAWGVNACYDSAGVVDFAAELGISPPPGCAFAGQRGVDLFNRKSHFRQLAAGIGLPLAEGSIVFDTATLDRALRRHIQATGTAIVKQDNNVFGLGNVAVTRARDKPLAGVREVIEVGGDWPEMVSSLWRSMSSRWSPQLVVESYHPARHIMYVEHAIDADGHPRFLDMGTLRMVPSSNPAARELVWMGLDIPAPLPPFAAARMVAESTRLAVLAAGLGYRGLMNIDALVTEGGDLLFNEVNGRWGGCSILHTMATRLLGPGYADRACVSSRRNIDAVPLGEALKALRASGLAFAPGGREGVVILTIDETFTSTMECLILGETWDRIREIEAALLIEVARVREGFSQGALS